MRATLLIDGILSTLNLIIACAIEIAMYVQFLRGDLTLFQLIIGFTMFRIASYFFSEQMIKLAKKMEDQVKGCEHE
jgi:hypothetical protein